jgi:Ca2+-binding EF-hand superfamily protein
LPAIPATSDATPPVAKSPGPAAPAKLRFNEMDADGNGLVSLAEFAGYLARSSANAQAVAEERARTGVDPHELLFRHIDRDNDNLLSETEVAAHQEGQK